MENLSLLDEGDLLELEDIFQELKDDGYIIYINPHGFKKTDIISINIKNYNSFDIYDIRDYIERAKIYFRGKGYSIYQKYSWGNSVDVSKFIRGEAPFSYTISFSKI